MRKPAQLAIAILLPALAGCGGESNSPSGPAPTTIAAGETNVAATAEPEVIDGKRAFAPCGVCHVVEQGKRSLVGPNLYAIVGTPAGKSDDFAYSSALRDSGIVWTEENLDAFIENPRALIPGNRMAFVGEKRAERRTAIIDYLRKQSDTP